MNPIDAYPDLKKKLNYELSKLSRSCTSCTRSAIIRKYADMAKERDKARDRANKKLR